MGKIIEFPNPIKLKEKRETLNNLLASLSHLTLSILSEMELPHYGKEEIPSNKIKSAQAISLKFIGRDQVIKRAVKSYNIQNLNSEILNTKKLIKEIAKL